MPHAAHNNVPFGFSSVHLEQAHVSAILGDGCFSCKASGFGFEVLVSRLDRARPLARTTTVSPLRTTSLRSLLGAAEQGAGGKPNNNSTSLVILKAFAASLFRASQVEPAGKEHVCCLPSGPRRRSLMGAAIDLQIQGSMATQFFLKTISDRDRLRNLSQI